MVPKGSTERVTAKMVYTGPILAPVREGDPIGAGQDRLRMEGEKGFEDGERSVG